MIEYIALTLFSAGAVRQSKLKDEVIKAKLIKKHVKPTNIPSTTEFDHSGAFKNSEATFALQPPTKLTRQPKPKIRVSLDRRPCLILKDS